MSRHRGIFRHGRERFSLGLTEGMNMWSAWAAVLFTLFFVSTSWAQVPGTLNAITDVPGIKVGNYTASAGASGGSTGTTVVIAPTGTVGGVTQRGGAPGTRETDLLRPE